MVAGRFTGGLEYSNTLQKEKCCPKDEPVMSSSWASLDCSFIPDIGEGTVIAKARAIGSF